MNTANKIRFEINKFYNFITINKLAKDDTKHFEENDWNTAFEDLKNNGICNLPIKINIPEKYQNVKGLHDEKSYDNFIIIKEKISGSDKTGKCSIDLEINSEIFKRIFTKEVYKIISKYYQKDFWVRNSPVLITDIENDRRSDHSQGYYHLDHSDRQLSLIILLNNTDENSTHTAYINRTNQNSWIFKSENKFNKNFKKRANNYADTNVVSKLIGQAGDVFLFDAGNGLHKGVYGKDRGMIHLNFSQMRRYAGYNDKYEKIKLAEKSKHFEILIDKEFRDHLNKNLWGFKNFKYTSTKF
ncbi:MAG: hypothetical protein HN601_04710 [Candidatus Marinimicrobia bacterium]|jgi:hypothetical protein|nr:hypothetical protein [Candidatus Neomarinimicrobiota bacterium]